jgi:hypothetical protein
MEYSQLLPWERSQEEKEHKGATDETMKFIQDCPSTRNRRGNFIECPSKLSAILIRIAEKTELGF